METIKIKDKYYTIKENEDGTLLLTETKKTETKKVKLRPDDNELYFYITLTNIIHSIRWDNTTSFDKNLWNVGNGFFTKEEAEKELERRKIIQLLKEFKLQHDNVELDWENYTQKKWAVAIDGYEKNKVCCTYACTAKAVNTIYFSSKDILDQAIYKIGEKRIYNAFK